MCAMMVIDPWIAEDPIFPASALSIRHEPIHLKWELEKQRVSPILVLPRWDSKGDEPKPVWMPANHVASGPVRTVEWRSRTEAILAFRNLLGPRPDLNAEVCVAESRTLRWLLTRH